MDLILVKSKLGKRRKHEVKQQGKVIDVIGTALPIQFFSSIIAKILKLDQSIAEFYEDKELKRLILFFHFFSTAYESRTFWICYRLFDNFYLSPTHLTNICFAFNNHFIHLRLFHFIRNLTLFLFFPFLESFS